VHLMEHSWYKSYYKQVRPMFVSPIFFIPGKNFQLYYFYQRDYQSCTEMQSNCILLCRRFCYLWKYKSLLLWTILSMQIDKAQLINILLPPILKSRCFLRRCNTKEFTKQFFNVF